ncbi:MAG: transporter substrate-binding domain-containing protein [Anaerolineales bacterium]|jgi:polar amino acid transport system substrate-binding protein
MKKSYLALTLFVILSVLLTSCGGAAAPTTAPTTAPQATAAPATSAPSTPSKLDEIMKRGTLVISTDPAYPPQSQLVENATRASDTKCGSDQHTANELSGFDIDVAVAIAKGLGVEPCFVTPDWTLITGGNWSDRWDISVGSMTVTPERMNKLYFSQPYYTTPAAFFVYKDNTTYTTPSDLSGKKVGACTGCTYDAYLHGTLQIPGEQIDFVVKNVDFVGYETDLNALQDLALGDGIRLDAVLTAQPTGAGAIKDGLPLKQLGDPVFYEYLAAAFDKESTMDEAPFVNKVDTIIQQLHSDGTLLNLSQKYYGTDLTSAAAKFDVSQLNQFK